MQGFGVLGAGFCGLGVFGFRVLETDLLHGGLQP